MTREHIHFVTGRLAEPALRSVVADLSAAVGFDYSVEVLPITVAALMTTKWVAKRISVPAAATRVLLPGYCSGDLAAIAPDHDVRIERGPRDVHALAEFFGQQNAPRKDYGAYDIEIIAEINHAPRMATADILAAAQQLADDGADVIDVGCDPGVTWSGVSDCVRALRDAGHRVSIDSFNPAEIAGAVGAGAELVLSVNATNRHAAPDWGCPVVVIPDELPGLCGLEQSIEELSCAGVPLRIDPVLEPIGLGFAASLGRYLEVRRRWPDDEIMMGIGNLTELTDVDSPAVNVLLLGICQELEIRSVLTTQVINWARTSVRECNLARRLVYYAVNRQLPPKHLEPDLVVLGDPRLYEQDQQEFSQLAAQIKDHNYRLFAASGQLHLISAGLHLSDRDPYVLFQRLLATEPKNVNASHAFYLGYEMAKAATALALGKQYRQDEALDWGFLTVPEEGPRVRRSARIRRASQLEERDGPG